MLDSLSIPRPIYNQLISVLQAVYPEEGCGLLAGKGRVVTHFYPIENIHHSLTYYELNPKQQIEAFMAAEARNEAILSIYHSHPASDPQPSDTDIEQANYPDLVYLIISLADRAHPLARAYQIKSGEVHDVSIKIV